MPGRTYTTTEISRICDVYPASVISWIDSGKLRAYVTPGGHRRVTREDLIEFLKKCRIPIPPEVMSDKKTVLIVEDEPDVARMIERALVRQQDHFAVQKAASGVEALVQIGQRCPDLVILDIVMPGMDGLKVCEKLRSMPETSSLKIIAISGKRTLTDKEIQSHGISAFLKKPFCLEDLVKTAAKLLRIQIEPSSKKAKSAQAV